MPTSEEHADFCKNVRKRRKQLALTQVQMADRLGVSQPTYAAIEAGRHEPGLNQIMRVAAALKISARDLISEAVKVE